MIPELKERITLLTGKISDFEVIQELWSGYGHIYRLQLEDGSSVITKHIKIPDEQDHPRGWNTSISNMRKLKSYEVEMNWYRQYAGHCPEHCKVPQVFHIDPSEQEHLIVMEDLNATGYALRKSSHHMSLDDSKHCLNWLALFHAYHMNHSAEQLWSNGTYWHLDTRPDELKQMQNQQLKESAHLIDQKLNACHYQTLVHGDAKLANFCFAKDGRVAAVDFQYIGRGCGMKDVAYFISSVYEEDDCERYEAELLDGYFGTLRNGIALHQSELDADLVIREWREMYDYAWADFYRFLDGWSPGHWKMHGYSSGIVDKVLRNLRKL